MSEVERTPPEHIGPFRVLHAIAAGGMAEVYAVEDPTSGERFALKLLVAVKVALKRFNREYEAMTRLNHPGIVRVYHYGLHDGHPWLTMELLRGTPAQPWVKSFGKPGSPQRTQEVLRVGYSLARALHYVHERGLVHRDLKSANVLVLPDKRVKLVDFGTAHLHDALERLTAEGEFVGTYAYASPEQLRGKDVTARSDLYSFGILLYRLTTGRRPFSTNDPRKLIEAHLKAAIPDPRTLVPDLDPRLVALIQRLLAKDPRARPTSAGEVAQQLEQLAGAPFPIRSPLALHDSHVTGREVQLQKIRQLHTRSLGTAVLILGEEGSDRDRLIETLLKEAVGREDLVFVANLREGHDIEGLMGLLKTVARAGTGDRTPLRALRKLAKANSTQLAAPRVRASLRRSVQDAFAALARERPVYLGVHGLEHATALTLEVLANVRAASMEAGLSVHLVASCSARHAAINNELARRFPDAMRVVLPALEPRQIALGVGAMLGRRPPPAQLSRELFYATDGQPAYVEAAVRDLVATGGLEADDGNRLEWAGAQVEVPIPAIAREDAEAVLARVPHLHRRMLEAIALLDDEVPLDLLAVALEWEIPQVAWIARDLVADQILKWVEPGEVVGWRRGRLGVLLEEGLRGPRRTAHNRSLARAIRPRAPTAAQVRLLLATGDVQEAFLRCTVAAREAFDAHRYREALQMLAPVLHQEVGVPAPLRAEAHLLYARCLHVLQPLDSEAARCLALARKGLASQPERLAEVDFATAQLAGAIGHHGNHAKHLESAWEKLEEGEDADLKARIALARFKEAMDAGRMRDAHEWLEASRAAAVRGRERALMGFATVAAARLALMEGDVSGAESQAGKAMQFFEKSGHPLGFFSALAAWGGALRHQGRYSEALAVLGPQASAARQAEDPSVYLRILIATGWCEIDLCRLGRAQEMIDEVAATVRKGEELSLQLEARVMYGRVLLASGQFMNAAFVLKESHERARNAQLTVLAELSRALWAETAWHLRDRTRAKELFQSALLGLRGTGARAALCHAIAARARVMAREVDPDELFKPIADLLDGGGMPTVSLEHQIASARWHRQRGDRGAMAGAYRAAARALNKLATHLNDTDRAALRVHPWSRRIRQGLR